MPTNPLKTKAEQATAKRTAQEWCDRGNAYLRGEIPAEHGKKAGSYIDRRDVHWVVRDGHPTIEWSTPSQGALGR